ncbi:MAG TPA: VWA domain-containing protein [Anaerolineales bacterium]|nr:VWA domain-containing protein [Anaerolineales bacterium]HRQ93166.1 VWA domain-containing protein [Anaerolineales bacterium]
MHTLTRFVLSVLIALSLLSGLAFAPPAQEEGVQVRVTQVDTSQFPRVSFFVSVTDADGNPYPVDPSRLQIMENGQPIALDQIEGFGEVEALTTFLVMDVSGSMNPGGKLDAAKAAAHQFVERMRAQDQTGLIAFNTQVHTVQGLTSDQGSLHAAIDSLQGNDDTAMYNALMAALDGLEGVSGRKAIIVLTDGLDNSSQYAAPEVLARLGEVGASISTVGLGMPGGDRMSGIDEPGLQDLAAQAGGQYGYAEDEASLTSLYQQYSYALQSEYQLSYISPASLRDGVNRSLSVALAPAGAVSEGNGQTSEAQSSFARYNPGGLVPEVAQPAAWPQFAAIVGVLVLLVALPMLANALRSGSAQHVGAGASSRRAPTKKRPRIKLKD